MEQTHCLICTVWGCRITPQIRRALESLGAVIPEDLSTIAHRSFEHGLEVLTTIRLGPIQAVFSKTSLIGYTYVNVPIEALVTGAWWPVPESIPMRSIHSDKRARSITQRVAEGGELNLEEYVHLCALDPSIGNRLDSVHLASLLGQALATISTLEGHQHS